MILFALAAGLILLYGAIYAIFCMQKGGISAALWVLFSVLLDGSLLVLLLYYRTRT